MSSISWVPMLHPASPAGCTAQRSLGVWLCLVAQEAREHQLQCCSHVPAKTGRWGWLSSRGSEGHGHPGQRQAFPGSALSQMSCLDPLKQLTWSVLSQLHFTDEDTKAH